MDSVCAIYCFAAILQPCFLMPSGSGILNIYPIPGPHRSVSSHWCGFSKTHTPTGRLLTKTLSRASETGVGSGGVASVRAHQSLCVCAALARWGFQMARSANRPCRKKKESVSRVQAGDVWRFCIPEKQPRLGRPPSGRPPLILFISDSQKQCQQAITVPPSQTIYVSFD